MCIYTGNPIHMKINLVIESVRTELSPYTTEEEELYNKIITDLQKYSSRIPAFLYGQEFIPGELSSFNFFEPRYKVMVENSAYSSGEFL